MTRRIHASVAALLLCFMMGVVSQDWVGQDYTYDQYEQRFQKNHQGLSRQQHKMAFQKNFKRLYEARKTNPTLQMNQFLDWTDQELTDFLNYKPLHKNKGEEKNPRLLQTTTFPQSYDYRTLGKVTPVKNQGSCGSCWAFASTAAIESHFYLQNNTSIDLAEQYPLDCTTSFNYGCQGGSATFALKLMNSTGSPLQGTFPYKTAQSTDKTLICGSTTSKTKLTYPATYITETYNTILTENQLISQLINYGPVVVGVSASDQNFMYVGTNGGVYNCAPGQDIDHVVLLVGYNSSFWFVKNSWGSLWGHYGYAYIDRNSDCGIKTILYSQVTPPPPPPPPPPPAPIVYITLRINMTDTIGDGWGWTLGLLQNGVFVSTFTLSSFTSGTVNASINAQVITSVGVSKSGRKNISSQIGFIIQNPETGQIIYQRQPGSTFTASIIFATFCPTTCTTTSIQRMRLSSSSSQGSSALSTQNVKTISEKLYSKFEVGLISTICILSTSILFMIGLLILIIKQKLGSRRQKKVQADSGATSSSKSHSTATIIPGDL